MRRVSGYFCVSQAGGVASGGAEDDEDVVAGGGGDGVIEPVELVVAFGGLERDQANSATRTKRMPAFSMRARSASQRASGHCSGYQAVPR